MLDNGFFLKNFEMHNWGNFTGYQKFNLRGQGFGTLFAEPSSSAILGVNGSGKSTLIDGFMIVLLPFEKSLKLGVTNDVETGSSGGRSVKDYVLGKYAAMGSLSEAKHEEVYSRKTGCSILLLNFGHASVPDRQLSVGRLWWYREGRVLDNSIFFISHKDLSINDLCVKGEIPTSAKSFKEDVAKKISGFDTYETAESYFSSLSACLGGVKKDDLKLLNRAFYVKSISNIDPFIRENMLVESESPHLDILLQNVRNGQEIAETIKICENKIELIKGVLRHLERMQEVSLSREGVRREIDILSLYPDWREIETLKNEMMDLGKKVKIAELQLPELESDAKSVEQRYQQTQALLANNSSYQNLQLIEERLKAIQEKIETLAMQKERMEGLLKDVALKGPKTLEDVPELFKRVEQKNEELTSEQSQLEAATIRYLSEKESVLRKSEELKAELQHLQNNKSLIHPDIYNVKSKACEELGIPKNHLMFVGEILNISKENNKYRRAAESVLDPISKNLLCHPDSLEKLTKWLNSRNLARTIVVKRIQKDELQPHKLKSRGDRSILNYVDLLSREQNMFHDYLQKWLDEVFDYQVVDVKEFQREKGKLVTVEGLVKSDERTIKKLKADLRFAIGWDPAERIEEVIADLHTQQKQFSQIENELLSLKNKKNLLVKKLHQLEEVGQEAHFEYLSMPKFKEQQKQLKQDEQQLREQNHDLDKLKEDLQQLKSLLDEKNKAYHEVYATLNMSKKSYEDRAKILPVRENVFSQTPLIRALAGDSKKLEPILVYLVGVDEKIGKGASYSGLQSSLSEKIANLSTQRESASKQATAVLEKYKNQFNDPNLSYKIPDGDITDFAIEWKATFDYLEATELHSAKDRFKEFFDRTLINSIKTTVNEFKSQEQEIQKNISSINEVLKLTNYEVLPDEERYLQIISGTSPDERVQRFRAKLKKIESVLAPTLRLQAENLSEDLMTPLMAFVEDLQKDSTEKYFVTDVRNHFHFQVHSYQRMAGGMDVRKEEFSGSRKDAKSSAQTTQLAYSLLASSLAYRFKFNDPIMGKNTLRCLILDEFGGKFDNEKPRDIVALLEKMGFQPLLVSPMSKADLLADNLSHLVMVHKSSAKESKVCSYPIMTRSEYERVLIALSQGMTP